VTLEHLTEFLSKWTAASASPAVKRQFLKGKVLSLPPRKHTSPPLKLFREITAKQNESHKYTVWAKCPVKTFKQVVSIVTTSHSLHY
jgi:hypothetical protein